MATRTTLSWLNSSTGADTLGVRRGGGPTTLPTPGSGWIRRSCWSRVRTFVAVAIAIPWSRISALVDGTRSPGFSFPVRIRCRISVAICWYGASLIITLSH